MNTVDSDSDFDSDAEPDSRLTTHWVAKCKSKTNYAIKA